MTKDNNFLAYLYLFLTVTFWAGNFVVGKLASFYEVPPFSLNFYRWLFAWLILACNAGTSDRNTRSMFFETQASNVLLFVL